MSYINEHGDILHQTPMHEVFNLRWYIQYLIDQNKNEAENPLSEQNWMDQTNWKVIKHVIHHRHSITPEQLKQKPFNTIFKKQHEKFYTEKKGSQMKRNRNPPHPQKSRNKILSLTHLLKMKKSQMQLKHFKFIMV